MDRRAWAAVCALGLNEAVAYLVLARGTGGDNRTTSWSVNSVENYTGISRSRALCAVKRLVECGIIRIDRLGWKPRYHLFPAHEIPGCAEKTSDPQWIWLPNALVDGAAGETPPIELLRQSQEVGALRLLVDLYDAHSLAADGGIPRTLIHGPSFGRGGNCWSSLGWSGRFPI